MVHAGLGVMWAFFDTPGETDVEVQKTRKKFMFRRWRKKLKRAIIRMSMKVKSYGPTSPGKKKSLLKVYLDEDDHNGPRIDLDNTYGVNLKR